MWHLFWYQRWPSLCVGRCGRELGAHCSRSSGRAIGRGADAKVIRVTLPQHLRTLAQVRGDVELEVEAPITQRSILDALEARYPMLRGTIRDHDTLQRRPFLRFFACAEDWSHQPPDASLPDAVVSGKEPFIIIGAIAGG